MTSSIEKLKKIISTLRHPKDGCPWDLSQTNRSLIPYMLEEAHEVVDAIRVGNDESLIEELGDLLFQILLHAEIAQEQKRFTLNDVITHLKEKLIRRHPHVFKKKSQNQLSIEEVKILWESIKRKEIQSKNTNIQSKHPLSDSLRKKIRSQPAIKGALEISKKVAGEGFEWNEVNDIWAKIYEELKELKEALDLEDTANAEIELGDVIFSLINIARWYNLSPEEGLDKTNKRFLNRFSYLEENLQGGLSKYDRSLQRQAWNEAKNLEKE